MAVARAYARVAAVVTALAVGVSVSLSTPAVATTLDSASTATVSEAGVRSVALIDALPAACVSVDAVVPLPTPTPTDSASATASLSSSETGEPTASATPSLTASGLAEPSTSASPETPLPSDGAGPTEDPAPGLSDREGLLEPEGEPSTSGSVFVDVPSPEPSTSSSASDSVSASASSEPVEEPMVVQPVVCAGVPSAVSAEAGMNEITVRWGAPEVGPTPSAYYVSVPDGRVYAVPSDESRLVVTGLRNGVPVTVSVFAATNDGIGLAASVSATPTSGADGDVAGLIVKLSNAGAGDVAANPSDVPGEERVDEVGLAVDGAVADNVVKVGFTEATDLSTATQIASELTADPAVEWAEPDRFVFTADAQSVPNDTDYATSQWNLWDTYGIGMGDGPTSMTAATDAGSGVTVAVIDTGITAHPDLDSQVVPGYDFVSDPEALAAQREFGGATVPFDGDYVDPGAYGSPGWDANPADPGDWRGVAPVRSSTWHGTQMAGVIAAQANNAQGIVGVAPGARVQPVRALSWRGGLLSDVAASITWASGGHVDGVADNANPSRVLNLSFAVQASCPVSLQTAIDDAVTRGSVVVAAAGNANDDVAGYAPANCAHVIAVGATGRDGKRAPYSNYGTGIDISAPGGSMVADGGVASTSNIGASTPAAAGYSASEGTSVAAAEVAGAAARVVSALPGSTANEAAKTLTGKNLRAFAGGSCDTDPALACGAGILSLVQVAATPTVTAPSTTPVFNVSTSGQDPGDFVVSGFAASDVVLVTIGFVNPPTGTTFALPTRTGLTPGYGYDLTESALQEVAFTASQANANAALAAMTVTTGATSGNVTLQVSASVSEENVYYNPINKHFYEYVPSAGITAASAFSDAAGKHRYGMTGYIVAIGTDQENAFISAKIQATNIWIGATDSLYEGIWKWYGGPDAGDQFWSGAASGSTTSYTDYTGTSTSYAKWCSGEPNNSGDEDHAVTNWNSQGSGCWNDLSATNSGQVHGYVVEYGDNANPSYSDVGSASFTAQVITKVTETVTSPASPNGNYTQSFTVRFSVAASGIDASDFANGSGSGAATGCNFVPSATSIGANTDMTVAVSGCSSGKLRLKTVGAGLTFAAAALEDTLSTEVTITSAGGTPAYPTISGTATVSGAWNSAIDLGTMDVASSSCTVGNVTATVTSSAGTLAATASGAAAVSTVAATQLTVTGSVADVDATLDSVTLTGSAAGAATVTTSLVPAANSSVAGSTYLFNPDNGHYYLVTGSTSWTWLAAAQDASTRSFCGVNGYIATLTTDSEYQFISARALTSNIGDIWIGGEKTDSWRWYPGSNGPVAESGLAAYDQGAPAGSGPWHASEPNNSGSDMQIFYTNGAYGWDDTAGSRTQRALVEFGTNGSFTAPSTSVAVTMTSTSQPPLIVTSVGGTYGSGLSLTTSGGSGTGAVTYGVSDGTASDCAVSGATLSTSSAGTCLVTATKASDADYESTSSGATTVTFAKASQAALTLTSTSGTYGSGLTLVVTGGSGGGALSYSVTNGTATGCTESLGVLTASTAGTCSVTATKATDTNYLVASVGPTTVTFGKANQSPLSVTSTSGTYGYGLTLATSGGSSAGAITWSYANGSASGCQVSAGVLSATSAGTCSVTATMAGGTNYYDVSSSATSVTFEKANQSPLSVTSTSGTYGAGLTLTTSGGSSGGSVSWSVSNGTATGCSRSGTSLSATSAGTCSVTATMAGGTNYNDVSSSATSVTFASANQSALSVTSTAGTFGSSLTLTTSGGSTSGAITWSYANGTASGCQVSAGVLSVTSAGTCSVTATMAGNTNYNDVSSSATTVTFAKATQSAITVTNDASTPYGSPLALSASGGSGTGALAWAVASGGCTVSQSGSTWTVTTGNVGSSCQVEATKLGDANYQARTSGAFTIATTAADQTLSFTSVAPTLPLVGDSYLVSASSSAGLTPTLDISSGSGTVCSMTSGTVTFLAAGTCVIRASQSGNANVNAALPVLETLVVGVPVVPASPSAAPAVLTPEIISAMTEVQAPPSHVTSGSGPTSVTVDGHEAPVVVASLPQDNGWMFVSDTFTMRVAVVDGRGDPEQLTKDEHMVLQTASQVQVAGQGFLPDSRVKVFLVPDTKARKKVRDAAAAVYLGDALVGADGSLGNAMRVPDDLTAQDYTLQVNGLSVNNEVRSLNAAVRVARATSKAMSLTRAGFFQPLSASLSERGGVKLSRIGGAIPSDATNVRVEIVGVSVSMPTLHENLALAAARAEKVANSLKAQGIKGTYTVTLSTTMQVGADAGGTASMRGTLGGAVKTIDGFPINTVHISYDIQTVDAGPST